MSTRAWLWKGTREDIHNPGRACLVAPLFALVPPLVVVLCRFVMLGSREFGNNEGLETVVLGGFFTLAISYGVTIALGLPWYLALSYLGWAGLIPVISGSTFPLIYLLVDSLTRGSYMPLGGYLFYFVCGLFPATAFWTIARKQNEELETGSAS